MAAWKLKKTTTEQSKRLIHTCVHNVAMLHMHMRELRIYYGEERECRLQSWISKRYCSILSSKVSPPPHTIFFFPFFLQNTKGFGCSFFGCIKVNYRWVMPRFEEISCGATGIIKIAQSCVCFGHESTISCKFHHFASLIFKSRVASKRRTISEKGSIFDGEEAKAGSFFFFFQFDSVILNIFWFSSDGCAQQRKRC